MNKTEIDEVMFPKENSDEENHERSNVVELGRLMLIGAREGDVETVRNLMKSGAPFTTDWLGLTPLHEAAGAGHVETCELLLRSGILKDARTKVDKTPLHMACLEGHFKAALVLIGGGADVNATDMLQMTPLHWAVEKENVETIRVLVQNGGNPHIVNKFDKTCYDIATEANRMDIFDMLQNEPRVGQYTILTKEDLDIQAAKLQSQAGADENPLQLEVRNVRGIHRPKTAIVLPTYQKKKTVTGGGSLKRPRVTVSEDSQSRLATLQLLEQHGIEMLEGEDINLVASAVGSGQTVVLTEAGKQALSLTDTPKPSKKPNPQPSRILKSPKIVRVSPQDILYSPPAVKKAVIEKKFQASNKVKQHPVIEDISKKFEEAKREAEQYKELYTRKQKEADEYREKLEKTMNLLSSVDELDEEELEEGEMEEGEDEDMDEEEEEELEDEFEEEEVADDGDVYLETV